MQNEGVLTSWSIQKKLLVLLLVVLLPACGIIIWSGLGHRRDAIREAENNALLLVESLADMQEQVATGTKQMLSTLAQLPEVRRLDVEACNKLFREVMDQNPSYANIFGATPDGSVFASSLPFEPGLNLLDRKHIKIAIDNLDFSVGEYMVGRITKVESLNYAYPVIDANRNLIAVVVAGFRLDEFARFIKKANLPEDSLVVITDHAGVRMIRLPQSNVSKVGKPIPLDAFNRISGNLEQGTFDWGGRDGIFRVNAFKQLRLREKEPPYLYLIVGLPKKAILHSANVEMLRNLSLLGVAVFITLCLAWVFGNVVFVRPINHLVLATRRFGKGETGVRTGLPHTSDELGELAETFDDMVSTIEVRDIERSRAEEALRESELRLRTILQTANEGFWLIDNDAVTRDINPRMCDILGRNREDILGRKIFDFVDNGNFAIFEEQVRLRALGQLGSYEIALSRFDGSNVFCHFNVTPLFDESGKKVGAFAMVADITERKLAVEKLQSSEELFRNIFEHHAAAKLIIDPDSGNIIDANDAAESFYGWPREQLRGMRIQEINVLSPEEIDLEMKKARTLERVHFEFQHRRADGSIRDVEVFSGRIVVNGKDLLHSIVHDVTERKLAEDALRLSEERFSRFFRSSPVGTSITQMPNGRFVDVNDQFLGLFGYTREEVIDRSPLELKMWANPEDRARMVEILNKEGRIQDFETQFRRKAGEIRDIRVSAEVIEVTGRKYILGLSHDITERKRSEEKLRESEAQLRQIIDLVPHMIFVKDWDGKYLLVNQAVADGYSLSVGALTGKHHSNFHPDERQLEQMLRDDREVMTNGKTKFIPEQPYTDSQGNVCFLQTTKVPFRAEGGSKPAVLGVAIDITERKRAEEEKERLEAQLRQAQKLEAIGTLAGGIAHDFNNILVPIMGYTEMALSEITQLSPTRDGLEQVLSAALRARDLVKQILAFGRIAKEQQQVPVEISPIVKEALKLLRASLPSSIEIRRHIEDVVANADPTQMHQVLMNLCTNAAHAMDGKGILDVRLLRVYLSESDLADQSIIYLKPGPHLKLSVSDTGIGMDGATLERIFEPYFTTKEVGKGSGLGLAVVRGIVKRHEGAIAAHSEPGKGTTFDVYIPAMEDVVEEVVEAGQVLPRGTERILLIDDEQGIVEMETAILERLGYKVTHETDSLHALEVFRFRPGEFELVITDYTMPKLTGVDLSKEIRLIRPDIPIILCTGFSEKVTRETIMDLGLELIMKPFGIKQMAELIREVLDVQEC